MKFKIFSGKKFIVKILLAFSLMLFSNNFISNTSPNMQSYAAENETQNVELLKKKLKDLQKLKLIYKSGDVKDFEGKESEIKKIIKQINKNGITREIYLHELIRKNKNKDKDEIVDIYYETNSEILGALMGNERIYTVKKKEDAKKILTKSEKKYFNEILKKIKNKENSFVRKLIKKPKEENIVIVNPGHGFEDSGAVVEDDKGKKIEEKTLNAKIGFELTKKLLKLKYDVYWIFDLKKFYFPNIDEKELNNLKKNPRLHIIFPGRPPISGAGENGFMAAADGLCMLEIMKKIKNVNPDANIASVCLHHNWINSKEICGFISFYRKNDNKVTKTFQKQSIDLAKVFKNNCANVYAVKDKTNIAKIQPNDFIVCGYDKKFWGAAVLLELGFMTNSEQLSKMLNKEYNKKMADALAKSIKEYFKAQNE